MSNPPTIEVSSRTDAIFAAVRAELQRARALHPHWPQDLVHAVAVVNEEAGEMVKAANEMYWAKGTLPREVVAETIQTLAMCVRLLSDTPVLNREPVAHE